MSIVSFHMLRPLIVCLALLPPALAEDAARVFQQQIAPILEARCTDCHGGTKPKAQLSLEAIPTLEHLRTHYHHWYNVLEQIETGTMPPEKADPLASADREALMAWIRGDLTRLLVEQQRREGRSQFRRLSRNDYANTVQDIFGIRPPAIRLMPGDGRVDGYDKVSKALPFSPAATEAQLKMAEATIERMFTHPQDRKTKRLWSRASEQSKGHLLELPDNWNVSFNSDTHSGALRAAKEDGSPGGGSPSPRKPGRHLLRMHVYGYQTDQPLPVGIYAGHVWAYPQILKLLKVIDVPPGTPAIVETEVYLRTNRDNDIPGDGIRLIPLGLGVPVPKNTQASERGKGKPGLAIQWIDIEELEGALPGQDLLFADLTDAMRQAFLYRKTLKSSNIPHEEVESMMHKTFARVGARLFRRDLGEAEVTGLTDRYFAVLDDDTTTLKDAFFTELVSLMTAPDFLCVVEDAGKLNDFALASRLAYFLWNSTPDAELLAVARAGKLGDVAGLRAQTERLLNDPKSDRFVEDFLDQWLGLWGLENTTPDRDLYPEYDDELKFSSPLETRASFRRMLDDNRSVKDFVAPDWAMINERLAELYGIPGVNGFGIRAVKLPADTPFGGIWTQASTLKVTANGTLTSPVKRGVWVSDRLLGISIPPPPSNIQPVVPDTRGAQTLREQLALHSQKGSCKACHARFDPYGFALESFDVMGNFRSRYRKANPEKREGKKWIEGLPVDCTGSTPDGTAFADIRELRKLLASHPEQLARGVVRHLLTYATGEPTSPIDHPAIEAIVSKAATDDYGLRTLLHGVIQSDVFRWK
jgi:cytochrome c553